MNIVLFNTAIGTSNNGDYIIYESAKEGLAPLLGESFVMEFGSHLNNLGMLHYLIPSSKYLFAKNCNYKFILGTNLLTSNMFRSVRQWPIVTMNRKIYHNSIMMGVGMTYDNIKIDPFTRSMYSDILRKDIVHSVRDEKSKELLESIKGINALNTGCPTLWKLTPDICSEIPRQKAKNVIISVSGYKNQIDKIADQKMINILESNYEDVYLWAQTTDDEVHYKSLQHKKAYKIIYSLKQFEMVCRNANVDYVGTRLHGGIFAMQNKVRSLIIEIDHRAKGFRIDNNINTLARESIDELELLINGVLETEIFLNIKAINEWKYQFNYIK